MEWSKFSNKCPYCRKDIPSKDEWQIDISVFIEGKAVLRIQKVYRGSRGRKVAARLAEETARLAEETARLAAEAARVAEGNRDIAEDMIRAFEDETGEIISLTDDAVNFINEVDGSIKEDGTTDATKEDYKAILDKYFVINGE